MKLTTQEIEHIAALARLRLTPEEKKMYAEQLSVVLEYMDVLAEVDVTGIEETCQVTGLTDVMRDDAARPTDTDKRNKLISHMSEREGALMKVQGVFEV